MNNRGQTPINRISPHPSTHRGCFTQNPASPKEAGFLFDGCGADSSLGEADILKQFAFY